VLGQFHQRAGALEIAIGDVAIDGARPGTGMQEANSVIADEAAVADQPGRDAGSGCVGAQHRFREVVVTVRLVDEAAAVCVHGDQSRLGAIEQDVRIDRVTVY